MGNNASNGEDEYEDDKLEETDRCETITPAVSSTVTEGDSAIDFHTFEFKDISAAAKSMFVDRKDTHSFQVRGATYLEDKKKINPGSAMCKLMLLELYEVESKDGDRHDHIAARGLAKQRREKIASLPGNPFQIIINFQIPGDPPISCVTYFALPTDRAEREVEGDISAFKGLFERFISLPATEEERIASWDTSSSSAADPSRMSNCSMELDLSELQVTDSDKAPDSRPPTPQEPTSSKKASGGWMRMPVDITWPGAESPGAFPQTDFRNMRFKLIPSVTEGPWVVKAAVRSQPALLGRKVVQRYFRGDNYMEIDIHVGSSVIASQVVGLCRGYAKNCAADIGIVIQGEDSSELHERILGCVSFNKIDMEVRQKLGD